MIQQSQFSHLFIMQWQAIVFSLPTRVRCNLQGQWRELKQAADVPLRLALTFAVGTMLAFLPMPIFDSLLTVALLLRFKGLNKATVFVARGIWNDLIVVPLYAPGYRLAASWVSGVGDVTAVSPIITTLLSFLLGCLLVTAVATSLSFITVFMAAQGYRLFCKR